MNGHPTRDDLQRFLRGELRADAVLRVARHLEECPSCGGGAASDEQVRRSTNALVRDLRSVDSLRARRSRRRLAIAAAAIVAIVAGALFVTRPAPPATPRSIVVVPPPRARPVQPPARAPYARAEWSAIVADAVRSGAIAMPGALADLHRTADPPRGATQETSPRLEPAGTIVETPRPRFRWPASPRASYVLSIYNGRTLIRESPILHAAVWQPDRELPRGRTLHWQVAVQIGEDEETILPAPPEPAALFRVLDARASDELHAARAAHPKDHLLLGVLYARNGLRAEAERELRQVESEEGRRLLRSVRAWKP